MTEFQELFIIHWVLRVKEFLSKNWDKKSPLLLGLSGGPDSKALLYSLLDAGCKAIHIAHVDHGWRKESSSEADALKREIETLDLPFHFIRLDNVPTSNQEDQARKERLHFFQSLFHETSFQALLLGHHADDLAETILKRVFEGAHLSNLKGMQEMSLFKGMPIWRPLLGIQKKEIFEFLQEHRISCFTDPTNEDPKYLRSRLRREMFPYLERCFGKKIINNLCLLSERAGELHQYLDAQVANAEVKKGQEIEVVLKGLKRIERRHLLQKVGAEAGVLFPRSILERVLDLVDGEQIKKIALSPLILGCGRGKVLFLKSLSI